MSNNEPPLVPNEVNPFAPEHGLDGHTGCTAQIGTERCGQVVDVEGENWCPACIKGWAENKVGR